MTPNWTRRYKGLLFLIPLVVFALVAALSLASTNSGLLDKYFPLLITANLVVAAGLVALTAWMFAGLYTQWRHHRFGSRLTTKLAIQIALIAILPSLLVYAVSSRFIGRSIDSWFNVRVERALDSGVELSRTAVSTFLSQTAERAVLLGDALADIPPIEWPGALPKLKEHYGLQNVTITSRRGEILAASLEEKGDAAPAASSDAIAIADARGVYSMLLEGTGSPEEADVQAFALAPIADRLDVRELSWSAFEDSAAEDALPTSSKEGTGASKQLKRNTYFLSVREPLPEALAKNINSLTSGYRDYQELVLSREGLRTLFTASLSVSMLLAALNAIIAAIAFTQIMMDPLRQLARGTRKVASGNLSPIQEFSGDNEINILTQYFNSMVGQLAEARKKVAARTEELEQTGQYLQSVLTNLSSGVIVIDAKKAVLTANEGAARILGDEIARPGALLAEVAPKIAEALDDASLELAHPIPEAAGLHREIEIDRIGAAAPLTLFVRASRLHISGQAEPGMVLVIDDMTQVIAGQRATAWGEVARRLAHEIKNPLTPIQLAAERLEMKLEGKLAPADEKLLSKSVSTIVTQVAAMKQMVDDFRNYAKLPPAVLAPTDLNALIAEVTALYGQAGKPVTCELQEGLPEILGDAAQLRQVFHNLVGNSLDALAGKAGGQVVISTAAVEDQGRPAGVLMRVTDNGTGFSPTILHCSFEPYVTTKATGTGLGLPMVKKIVDEHKAEIRIENLEDASGAVCGACVEIAFRPWEPRG